LLIGIADATFATGAMLIASNAVAIVKDRIVMAFLLSHAVRCLQRAFGAMGWIDELCHATNRAMLMQIKRCEVFMLTAASGARRSRAQTR
jgi:hypothetical protein